VRIFKGSGFDKFARKEGITDDELREMANLLEQGRFEADLGGGVYKMRVARPGEGKSGGYRVIMIFKREQRLFFVYGFAKSDRGNISRKEKKYLKEQAKDYLTLSEEVIDRAVKTGSFIEI